MELPFTHLDVPCSITTSEGAHERLFRGRFLRPRPTRLYVTEPETHFENVALRRSRPVELWREFAQAGLAAVFGAQDITLVFDQKAGCSVCPCSPGFFLVRNRRRQVVVADGIVDFASLGAPPHVST